MNSARLTILICLSLVLISSAFASVVFPKQVVFFDKLVPGNEQTKSINNPDILFTKLSITSSTNISRARITVQAMSDCPEVAPYQENVLQCFYISGFEITDNDISSAKISFNVPEEWIETNGYSRIELRRYSYSWNKDAKLSEWKSLKTEVVNNNYLAYSDGIGYFSIVGIKANPITAMAVKEISEQVIVPEMPLTAETHETEPVSEIPKTESIPTPKANGLFMIWTLAVMGILVSSLIPRKKKFTKFEELTHYVRNNPRTTLRSDLRNVGWEDWQLDLAFREIKRR